MIILIKCLSKIFGIINYYRNRNSDLLSEKLEQELEEAASPFVEKEKILNKFKFEFLKTQQGACENENTEKIVIKNKLTKLHKKKIFGIEKKLSNDDNVISKTKTHKIFLKIKKKSK